jgi:MoaA/NifB/PqqE/SkfB family radical SAM enzyme
LENLQKSQEDEETDVRKAAFNLEAHPCMINKIHLSIGSDGNVFPCEVIADDTSAYVERDFYVRFEDDGKGKYQPSTGDILHTLGNVNDESLIDIWKRNFRNSFRSPQCVRCWSRYQPIINSYHENKGRKTFI